MTPYSAGQAAALRKYAGSGMGAFLGGALGGLTNIPGSGLAGAGLGAAAGNALSSDEESTPWGSAAGAMLGRVGGALAGAPVGLLLGSTLPKGLLPTRHGGIGNQFMQAPGVRPELMAAALLAAGLGSGVGTVLGARKGHQLEAAKKKKDAGDAAVD